ncbi:MAG: M48 family metallopeptidase, partial [Planctomycetes bacterium]|nr:M48 family metallopeptidase [Planctomycetota bacterium]
MPIPFDMLLVMLFIGYYAETPVANPPPVGYAVLVNAAAMALMLAASACVNHIASGRYRRPGRTASKNRALAADAELLVRLLLTVVYAAAIFESALPWSLARALGTGTAPDSAAILVFGLAPYVLLFFCAWLPMYGFHRLSSFGRWTRRSFLVHKARYNLYMLVAWIPFALLAEWLGEFLIILPVLFLAAAWGFPAVLAKTWGCTPVTDSRVLDSVHRLEKLSGVRFSKIYLWEPGGGNTQNAAAVGIFRPFRYLFLTPALVRNMRPEELEAVVLHELGHIYHRHLLFYMFTSLAGINLAVIAGALLPLSGTTERFIVTGAFVLFYFRFVFGWLSRNMERQADLFAFTKAGNPDDLANALEKLGLSAGNIRNAESWHHLGIAERVDFLRRAERNQALVNRHNRRVARIKQLGYAASAVLIVGLAWLVHGEVSRRPPPPPAVTDVAHWRRVRTLLPDDPVAPLALAYRLAGDDMRLDEAADLARQAQILTDEPELRKAAAKLLEELNR